MQLMLTLLCLGLALSSIQTGLAIKPDKQLGGDSHPGREVRETRQRHLPANKGKSQMSGRAVARGKNCDFIDLAALPCVSGEKFVFKGLKGPPKIRRQFLVLSDKQIVAFLQSGNKVTNCSSLNNITTSVTCKVKPGPVQRE